MTALSVAAWGHSSTMGHVSRSPLRSRTVGFPESGSDLGSARHFSDVDLPSRPWGSSAGAHPPRSPPVYPHPCPERDGSCRNIGAIIRHHSLTVMLRSAECPEPLCLWWASPRHRVFSENTSEDVTLPSSLLRAHAPDHVPPPASRHCPWPGGLCRLSPVPAGRWPFPTLSLQSVRRRLDPYPAAFLGCLCPLLLQEHRPHVTGNTFGTRSVTLRCNFAGRRFRGCSHSMTFQAPTLARPPGCTHRSISSMPGSRAVYTTHRPGGRGGPHPLDRCSSQLRWNPGS